MKVEKNATLTIGKQHLYVMDYLFYRGGYYLLAVETDDNSEFIGDKLMIFEEIHNNDKLFIQRVKDTNLLNFICPIFEQNLRANLV